MAPEKADTDPSAWEYGASESPSSGTGVPSTSTSWSRAGLMSSTAAHMDRQSPIGHAPCFRGHCPIPAMEPRLGTNPVIRVWMCNGEGHAPPGTANGGMLPSGTNAMTVRHNQDPASCWAMSAMATGAHIGRSGPPYPRRPRDRPILDCPAAVSAFNLGPQWHPGCCKGQNATSRDSPLPRNSGSPFPILSGHSGAVGPPIGWALRSKPPCIVPVLPRM